MNRPSFLSYAKGAFVFKEAAALKPMGPIQIRPGEAGRLIVLLPYTPERVAKMKTVVGRRWHPKEQYWTVPHTDGALARLLALFAGEPVEVDPSLRPVRTPDNREPPPEPESRQAAKEELKVKRLSQDGQATSRSGGLHRVINGSRPVAAPTPKLLDRVREAIRTRHYSYRTEKAYVHWIKRFIFFHKKRHPVEWARQRSVSSFPAWPPKPMSAPRPRTRR